MRATAERAAADDTLRPLARQLLVALQTLESATRAAWMDATPEQALANATPYLQAFGHLVLAWLWLDVALGCDMQSDAGQGRRAAMRYFYAYELPKIDAWLLPVAARQPLCREMRDDWF